MVPGWAPRSPVCMETSHRPHLACPARGPRGLAPPSPWLSLTPRTLRPLSSLCKGRPGTEQPVAAYHRPSCPGAHHYLPPPHIQVGSFSQNSSPPCRHSLGRPTELPGSSPFQSDPARRRRAAPLLRPPIYNPHSRSADQEVPLRQTMTVAGQLEEAKLGIN